MKLSKLLLTTSLCAAVSGTALAQGKPFNEVDADGDGSLTLGELISVFGQVPAERIMIRADSDGDGQLTRLEIRARNGEDDEDDEDDDEDADEDADDEDDENEDDVINVGPRSTQHLLGKKRKTESKTNKREGCFRPR